MATENSISTYNETELHAALKSWYQKPGDRLEVEVDGYIVDLVQGDLLVEIQTQSFASLKEKLASLTRHHPVRLVHPIAYEKWIVKLDDNGQRLSRRKSPKRGSVEHLFYELVSIPHLIQRPNFSLEVLLIQEEEFRRHQENRRWRRRGWVTAGRRLLQVLEQHLFVTEADFAALIPAVLSDPFGTAELAEALGCRRPVAQKMAYCLRRMQAVRPVGKDGNAILYARMG